MNFDTPLPLDDLIDLSMATLPAAWNIVRGHIHAVANERFEMTAEQFHIMRHISRGVNSVSQIAAAKRISPSAISQSVDILVNRGLILRSHDADDRRRITLALTPQGQKLLAEVFAETHAWLTERWQNLTPEQVETAMRGLTVLAEALDIHPSQTK
jgi:DNA-binding MarR family transcriptional regulator